MLRTWILVEVIRRPYYKMSIPRNVWSTFSCSNLYQILRCMHAAFVTVCLKLLEIYAFERTRFQFEAKYKQNAPAISNSLNKSQSKTSWDKLMQISIALIDQCCVLMKKRRNADRSWGSVELEHSWSNSSGRAVVLRRNLIVAPCAGFTRQRLRDTTHPSPRCTPRRRAGKN